MKEELDIIQSFNKIGCKCSNNGYHLYDIQKWLREVKKIYVLVNPVYACWNIEILKYDESEDRNFQVNINGLDFKDFNIYEEALEAGIWESYYIINN